ncbi:MAG: MBL fold metallo-hydrolase [Victivallales bacterium]|nr:MBL fold metallo-hydrolase [Victivallales bacterium]
MRQFEVTQLAVGGFDHNFSYVVYAPANGDAAVVDPCGEAALIVRTLRNLPLCRPRYILLTHGHRDHCSALTPIRAAFAAPVAAHPLLTGCHRDIVLNDRQRLPFGDGYIEVLFTPGHTADGVTYRLSDDSGIFTGDTLFVDWIGYCDAPVMYRTLRTVIHPLPDSNIVYSGHDYGREPISPLGVDKRRNAYLSAPGFAAFRAAMKEL